MNINMKIFFQEKEVKSLKKRFNNRKLQMNHKFINFLGIFFSKNEPVIIPQCMIHIRASEIWPSDWGLNHDPTQIPDGHTVWIALLNTSYNLRKIEKYGCEGWEDDPDIVWAEIPMDIMLINLGPSIEKCAKEFLSMQPN